jgi:SAM-dependent methyltransferase
VKQTAAATARNREPIRAVLAEYLATRRRVLEIASGTGEHAVHMARAFPEVTWQPTDVEPAALASIAAWRDEAGLPNLLAPIELDVCYGAPWPDSDVIVCINMVHISSWAASLGLFDGAGRTLPPNGILYMYGPYRFDGELAPASNVEFDRWLRERNPDWGVRDIRDLRAAAEPHGLMLETIVAMPANNHSLIFRRGSGPEPG